MLSINPDAADRHDVARLAAELIEALLHRIYDRVIFVGADTIMAELKKVLKLPVT